MTADNNGTKVDLRTFLESKMKSIEDNVKEIRNSVKDLSKSVTEHERKINDFAWVQKIVFIMLPVVLLMAGFLIYRGIISPTQLIP